jgi:drug/metabolite transporter (DMT)-like permease
VSAVVAHFSMKNDRMSGRKTFSILLGLAGIALLALAGKPWEPIGARECGGLLLLLCASTIGAFGNVVVARGRNETLHPVALASLQMMIGGIVLLTAGYMREDIVFEAFSLRFCLVLGWLSFISAAAFSIWFLLLQRVAVSELNLWKFLIPLSGAVLSWLLIKEEHPDILSLMGMLLVVIGIISSQRASRSR